MTEPVDPLRVLEHALAEPPVDLADRAALLDEAAGELRSALASLDGV